MKLEKPCGWVVMWRPLGFFEMNSLGRKAHGKQQWWWPIWHVLFWPNVVSTPLHVWFPSEYSLAFFSWLRDLTLSTFTLPPSPSLSLDFEWRQRDDDDFSKFLASTPYHESTPNDDVLMTDSLTFPHSPTDKDYRPKTPESAAGSQQTHLGTNDGEKYPPPRILRVERRKRREQARIPGHDRHGTLTTFVSKQTYFLYYKY